MRAMGRLGAVAVLALALGGCLGGLGGGKLPPTLFSLTAARSAAAGAEARGTSGNVLMVMEPETDRRLAVQRVPVQVSASEAPILQRRSPRGKAKCKPIRYDDLARQFLPSSWTRSPIL